MRLALATLLLTAVPNARCADGGLEALFQESSRLVVEINALDRDLQLHATSFGRQGRSPKSAGADAKRLSQKTAAVLKRWKTPTKEWKSLDPNRRRELEGMRDWLSKLHASALGDRLESRLAFHAAAAACDDAGIRRGLELLCASGCSPAAGALLAGYRFPCSLRAVKAALSVEMNRQLLLGGNHRAGIEDGVLRLNAHETEGLRGPLSRYWNAFYAKGLEGVDPSSIPALLFYGDFLRPDAPEAASDGRAVERVLSVWNLTGHADPARLLEEARAAAKSAYEELGGEAAAATERSSRTDSLPSARDAIARVLRAGGSERGVSNDDANKLLAGNPSPAPGGAPAHSLREAVLRFPGESALASVVDGGRVVFSDGSDRVRVIADPGSRSFRICRAPCGPGDFLAIDGTPVPSAPAEKPKKKKRWWSGGSDDEEAGKDAPPPPPTVFLIQELR